MSLNCCVKRNRRLFLPEPKYQNEVRIQSSLETPPRYRNRAPPRLGVDGASAPAAEDHPLLPPGLPPPLAHLPHPGLADPAAGRPRAAPARLLALLAGADLAARQAAAARDRGLHRA